MKICKKKVTRYQNFDSEELLLRVEILLFVLLPYIDRNNFIQLNIYYEELSYEKIEQKKSFEIESLFSEVGYIVTVNITILVF